ncbi:MAG: ATP-binding protein [Candidatus Omnitrophica bacterium]|nr:ATP-binding protein [Candidatus Omnitrophota bacterium]
MFIEPVSGKNFFGRETILAILHKRVAAIKGGYRQNLALAGSMLAGKSSILRHFLKGLKDPAIVPIYIEMMEEDFKVFSTRFMATLLYQYLRSMGIKHDGEFENLRAVTREMLPATSKQIDDISGMLEKGKDTEAYENLLDLTSTFKYETGKNCVVVFDEFHNLSNFNLKKPFQIFGKFIMVQKNTMYIVSSSQKTLLKEILSKKLSLLFGNFEILNVEGFDNETARSFIAEKVRDIDIPASVINYILEISKGNPFYIETTIKSLLAYAKGDTEGKAHQAHLFSALAGVLYDSDGILNQYFTNNINFFLEKSSRKSFIPVLISLSKGNSKIKLIRNDIKRTIKDISEKLNTLIQMDLVYKTGVFYKIDDPLFEFWLRNVYDLKQSTLVDDPDMKYREFLAILEKDFSDFTVFSHRDPLDVICGLFSSFRDEKVNINMQERQLPFFDEVRSAKISGNMFEVLGRKGKQTWLCHIKREDITDENDVMALCKSKSSENSVIARRMIIPFQDIDHNAFLMAKENGVWVWDIKQLNQLLRLFNKFEIVL